MTFEWFDAAKAIEFGGALADFFIERIPLLSEKRKAKNLDRRFEVADKMYLQIEQFKARHKLNVYKKAKLAGAFKSKLINAGFDSKLVDEVTLGVMKVL